MIFISSRSGICATISASGPYFMTSIRSSLEFAAQDEQARPTFFEEAPQLGLGHGWRRLTEHLPQSPPKYGIELQPRLGHAGFGA